LILVDPLPRTLDVICDARDARAPGSVGRLEISEDRPLPDAEVDRLLPGVSVLIGQTAMSRARLDRASHLKAIFNVETNFLPNIDYQACHERGIWVLSPDRCVSRPRSPRQPWRWRSTSRAAFAADRAFRAARRSTAGRVTQGCFQFTEAPVGLIGFGDLGRALRALLVPFRNPVTVYDRGSPTS